MELIRQGQSVRVRHTYTSSGVAVTPVTKAYALSLNGVSVETGTPTLALPESQTGLYEVIKDTTALTPDSVYCVTFSGTYGGASLIPQTYYFMVLPTDQVIAGTVTLADMVNKLKKKLSSDIIAYYTDSNLQDIIYEALYDHDDSYTFLDGYPNEIPQSEIPLVVDLAKIKTLYSYMSSAVPVTGSSFEIQSMAGKVKETTGMKDYLQMLTQLQKLYDNSCARRGVGQYKIEETTRVRYNRWDKQAKSSIKASAPKGVILSGVRVSSTEVDLTWTKNQDIDFNKYEVYMDDVLQTTIYDNHVVTYTIEDITDLVNAEFYIIVYNNTLKTTGAYLGTTSNILDYGDLTV